MKALLFIIIVCGCSPLMSEVKAKTALALEVFTKLEEFVQSTPDSRPVDRAYKKIGEEMLTEVLKDRRYRVLFQMANNCYVSGKPFILFGEFMYTGMPFSFSGILMTEEKEVRIYGGGGLEMEESSLDRVLDSQRLFSIDGGDVIYIPQKINYDPPGVLFVMSSNGIDVTLHLYYDPISALYEIAREYKEDVSSSTLIAARFCFSALLTHSRGYPDVFRVIKEGSVDHGVRTLLDAFKKDVDDRN